MMKPTMHNTLIPMACSIAFLQAWSPASHAAEPALRVEPLVSVHHSERSADGLYQLGKHHQGAHKIEEAIEAYQAALAIDASHVDARNGLAAAYSAQRRFDAALEELRTALQAHGKLSYLHANLGYTHYLMEDYPAALAELGNAIALDPANARAFGNLALVHERMGASDKARFASLQGAAALSAPAAAAREATASITPQPAAPSAPAMLTASAVSADVLPPPAQAAAPLVQAEQQHETGFAIEIANGTPHPQRATEMAGTLRRLGFAVGASTELRPFTQQRTVILYRDGFLQQALALRRSFAVPPAVVNNTRTRKPSDSSAVRLVLGNSAASATVLASAGTAPLPR